MSYPDPKVVGEPDPEVVGELRKELGRLVKQDASVVDSAVAALVTAADNYRSTKPLVDSAGRRNAPQIALARAAMTKLEKLLNQAHVVASTMPINAVSAWVTATDMAAGRLREVGILAQGAKTTVEHLRLEPDKPTDHYRAVLAHDVAIVFTQILGQKPSSTRDTSTNVTRKRGGAAYATTLRLTLKLAGVQQVDIGPVIDNGLLLLSDPDIPHNLP